jgi:hypothetical protein
MEVVRQEKTARHAIVIPGAAFLEITPHNYKKWYFEA